MCETRPHQNQNGSDIAAAVSEVQTERSEILGRPLTEAEMGIVRIALHRGLTLAGTRRKQAEPRGYAAYEGAEEDRPDGEEGVIPFPLRAVVQAVQLPVVGFIGEPRQPRDVNDRLPNGFRGGRFHLEECFACDPDGVPNDPIAIDSGTCAWCGWPDFGPDFPKPTGKAA